MTESVPAAASIEQLRKRAKDLRRSTPSLKLTEAQHLLAREHGFPSWPKLKSYVDRLERFGPGLRHAYQQNPSYYAERAVGLLASAADGTPEALAAFEKAGVPVSLRGARTVVASQHGFADWAALRRHIDALAESGEPFVRAYQAIETQDPTALVSVLERFPELVAAQGTNGNDLLGMAAATCDERLVQILLDRGADVDHANAHGWTALHQAGYLGLPRLARLLLDAGARWDVSARGDGGTPLVAALFWGHTATAEVLASPGLSPLNLRVAAGLGRVELIPVLLDGDPGAHRAFYRPHSGFPAWQPSHSRAEILDEALCWAARNGQAEAIRVLVEHGADVAADVYRGTALIWAAYTGKLVAVQQLLDLEADPSQLTSFGGPDHGNGVTALHLAAEQGHTEVIRALLAAGADPTVQDASHGGTPADWAHHGHQPTAAALLTCRNA